MIVPMKKIHLIFHSSLWENNTKELQELGLVDTNFSTFNTDTDTGKEYLEIRKAGEILKEVIDNVHEKKQSYSYTEDAQYGSSAFEIAREINGFYHNKESLIKENGELQAIYDELAPLGIKTSLKTLEELKASSNLTAKVYKAEKKASNPIKDVATNTSDKPEDAKETEKYLFAERLSVNSYNSYWLVVAYNDAEIEVPNSWAEYKLPDQSAEEIAQLITFNENQIKEIDNYIEKKVVYYNTLIIRKVELENILTRETLITTSDKYEDQLLVVQGFFPKNEQRKIEEYAESHAWGIVVSEPEEGDYVPTLLKMNWFVKIIQPLFKLMDTVPGYREFDISMWFLLFITLFFSMIIGDAGYGAVMFTFTLILTIKAFKKGTVQKVHFLLLWFSSATIVWGAITGNWFGYLPIAEHPFFKQFVLPQIAVSNPDSDETIKLFSFRIGLVHLLLAHSWGVLRRLRVNFWSVIHELAQAGLIFGLYFVTLFLLLDPAKYPLPSFTLPVIFTCFGLIVVTCEQENAKNFLVGLGKGLANLFTLFLGGVGTLADIISYIRLFAVGLASLAIAQSFNNMGINVMAIGAGTNEVLSVILIIAGSLVIGLGHVLNLAMALLAVMVHGVRLNMLEFGMHLGMEWTGRNFSPLQKKILSLEENNK